MAKTKTAKTVKTAVETTEKETLKAVEFARKGALAYVGLHVVAFEEAKTRFTAYRTARKDFIDTLVVKGEEIEDKATVFAKETQIKATEQFADATSKVGIKLPFSANDHVKGLEAEIKTLNKKIAQVAKTKKPVAKKTARKTTKKAA